MPAFYLVAARELITRQEKAIPLENAPEPASTIHTALPRAPQSLLDYLESVRREFVDLWVRRATELGPHYQRRSRMELQATIGQSYQANLTAMAQGDPEVLDMFVAFITRLRLEAGFPLSEVQRAFDLFRVLLTPRIMDTLDPADAAQALAAVNACVSYQIHSFSDRFQHMHEAAICNHARDLEQEVAARSRDLAASRLRYKTLVEEINDGYFMVQGMRITFANHAFCAMHAASADQMLSTNFLRLVARPDRRKVAKSYRDLLAGRLRPKALEYQRLGLNGEQAATEIKARMVDLGRGPVLIGICRDISYRVAMELKIREHQRMAYVGQLTASLSHELRNPLSTIKMNLQMLERRPALAGPDRERLGLAVGEVTRLEGILRQLLDVAKPLVPDFQPVKVNRLVSDCLALLAPQLAERGLKLRRVLEPGLGRLNLDPGMVEQALINLLLNAMDAAGRGGHITVTSSRLPQAQGPGCTLSVRDNGPGLTPEDMDRIFTPFFTRKGQGTGLGLTNVARIAKAHNGAIKVESRPGQGAKFILELPAHP